MERGSDKHATMIDEARSEEFREQEGPGDGEPTPDARLRGGAEIPPAGLSLDDLNGRAELARFLEHRNFPARPRSPGTQVPEGDELHPGAAGSEPDRLP